jgi:hypothetical protein
MQPLPPCTCPLPLPLYSATLRRVEEEGKGNSQGQSASQAAPRTLLPAALLSPRRSQPPCCCRRQKRRGEWGGGSCRGLRPSRLALRIPPFHTSIDQKSLRSPHNHHRQSQKGGRGKEEQPRPLGLPGCPCDTATATPPVAAPPPIGHRAQPPICSTACTPLPSLDLAT